jgi:methyl-accepting chemotaxis protein
VASEVRALAKRSETAAKEIKDIIDTAVLRVQAGSGRVARGGTTMTGIVSGVSRVTSIIGDIAAASTEQSRGIAELRQWPTGRRRLHLTAAFLCRSSTILAGVLLDAL